MTTEYNGAERRAPVQPLELEHLSANLIDEIAERAANKAVKKLTDETYKAIGKSVTEKFLYIVGVITVGLYLMGQTKGWWK